MDAPELFNYADCLQFLRDHAEWKKHARSSWSYQVWARQLGLANHASITKVLRGEREISKGIESKLLTYFAFGKERADYFRCLVALRKNRTQPAVTLGLLEKLSGYRKSKPYSKLDPKSFSRVAQWYTFVLRELIQRPDFQADPKWIARQLVFEVEPTEIQGALNRLMQTGMIRQDADGRFVRAEAKLKTDDDTASESVRAFHAQMLQNATRTLDRTPVDRREFRSSTMMVKPERLCEAKALIREFQDRFADLMEDGRGSSVYALQVQFFPLSTVSNPTEESA